MSNDIDRPIDIDVIKDNFGNRATITSFTDAGGKWLITYMTMVTFRGGIGVVRVDNDAIDELIEDMTTAGLKVALR